MKKEENKEHQFSRDVMLGGELWTDGLICAFEFIRGHMNTYSSRSKLDIQSSQPKIVKTRKKTISKCKTTDSLPQYFSESNFEEPSLIESGATDSDNLNGHFYNQNYHLGCFHPPERSPGNCWMPIGWARISDLLQKVQVNAVWDLQHFEFTDEEDDMTVADIAAPYWERPTGPTWWCHVDASHPFINTWLSNAQWLHPAISIALRDESKLISERMKHLLYEVLIIMCLRLLFNFNLEIFYYVFYLYRTVMSSPWEEDSELSFHMQYCLFENIPLFSFLKRRAMEVRKGWQSIRVLKDSNKIQAFTKLYCKLESAMD